MGNIIMWLIIPFGFMLIAGCTALFIHSKFYIYLKEHMQIEKDGYGTGYTYTPVRMSFKRFMKIYPIIEDHTSLSIICPIYTSSRKIKFKILFSIPGYFRYYYWIKCMKKNKEQYKRRSNQQIDMSVFLKEVQNDINKYIQNNVIDDTTNKINNIKQSKACDMPKIIDESFNDYMEII